MPIQPNRILIHYGEIALKGKNRADFETKLCSNIEHRLLSLGLVWPVKRTHDRIYVEMATDARLPLEDIVTAIGQVAGIVSLAPAICLRASATAQRTNTLDQIEEVIVAIARARYTPNSTFAVRVNRADKRFALTSQQLEHRLGAAIIHGSDWARVNLNRPDQTFYVDIDAEGIYCYWQKIKGIGGLPVGSAGQVLSLLSGGIDSPVATYLLAKRGCRVDLIHMTATQRQQIPSEDTPVSQLARQLSRFTLRSRLYLVPSIHFDIALPSASTGYELVLLRRFMARTAQALARQIGAQALVTGDSLGQVASQTLENLVATSMAVELPILRPLISYDKQEIIAIARKIGTYETAIIPYKDCCALLSQHPRTKSTHMQLTALEQALLPDYQRLIDATLADAVCLEYDCAERIDAANKRGVGGFLPLAAG